jgi:hypothetical protein
MEKLLLQFIPIMIVFFLLTYFKGVAKFSRTILGKILAVSVILFYSSIDRLYGLLICGLVILYYQSDFIENMLNWSDIDTVSPMNETNQVDDPVYIGGMLTSDIEPFEPIDKAYTKNEVKLQENPSKTNGLSITDSRITNEQKMKPIYSKN